MRVRAIATGVDERSGIRHAGEVFEHRGRLGSWMVPAEEPEAAAEAAPSEPPAADEAVTEEPASEAEAQPAASNKRQLRNRKPAKES